MFTRCPICESRTNHFFNVPFIKENIEVPKKYDMMIQYNRCPECDYIFAPVFKAWTEKDFKQNIYNEDYIKYDPEFLEIRPHTNAKQFYDILRGKRHLDYGGGSGRMSNTLKASGIDSHSYDVFFDKARPTGQFDVITCIEVLEHSIDPLKIFADIFSLLKPKGKLILKTSIVDFWNCKTDYEFSQHWYVMPRSGHIGFYSIKTLQLIADKTGFNYSQNSHVENIFIKLL